MSLEKATEAAKTVVNRLKENKLLPEQVEFFEGCPVTDKDGKESKQDLVRVTWSPQPNDSIELFILPDGRMKLKAMYRRRKRIAIAVREDSWEAAELDDAIKELQSIFDDTSNVSLDVLAVIPGVVAIPTGPNTATIVSNQN